MAHRLAPAPKGVGGQSEEATAGVQPPTSSERFCRLELGLPVEGVQLRDDPLGQGQGAAPISPSHERLMALTDALNE